MLGSPVLSSRGRDGGLAGLPGGDGDAASGFLEEGRVRCRGVPRVVPAGPLQGVERLVPNALLGHDALDDVVLTGGIRVDGSGLSMSGGAEKGVTCVRVVAGVGGDDPGQRRFGIYLL
eukprot:2248592-Rhodomonas_salina.1